MNTEDYQHLLRRFCEQERLDPDDLLRDGLLTVDGRRVAMVFEPGISADHILVRVELGEIPGRILVECLRAMLVTNHQWGLDGSVFSLQPDSTRAVLTTRILADASTTAPELRRAFDSLGVLLRYWSSTVDELQLAVS